MKFPRVSSGLCWEGLEETDNEEAQIVRSVGWTIKHGQKIRHNSIVTIEYHIETESILLLKLLSMFGVWRLNPVFVSETFPLPFTPCKCAGKYAWNWATGEWATNLCTTAASAAGFGYGDVAELLWWNGQGSSCFPWCFSVTCFPLNKADNFGRAPPCQSSGYAPTTPAKTPAPDAGIWSSLFPNGLLGDDHTISHPISGDLDIHLYIQNIILLCLYTYNCINIYIITYIYTYTHTYT